MLSILELFITPTLLSTGVLLNNLHFAIRSGYLCLGNRRLFRTCSEDMQLRLWSRDVTARGDIYVLDVSGELFSVLVDDGYLLGWDSYSDNLFVCDGGGVSYEAFF